MPSRKARLDKLLKPYGVEIVKNVAGGTYFYFVPLKEGGPEVPSVYVYRFSELTDDEWVAHVAQYSEAGQ